MKCRWTVAPQAQFAADLASALKLSPLLAQCLFNRGLRDRAQVEAFLEPRLKQLTDPFLLPHMDRAVERLFEARTRNEPLVIFGDYDVDGVTSTALLTEVLGRLGWKVHCYLPHRLDEGYGLSLESVGNCLKKLPVTLLLAVDCGSTSVAAIDWLRGQKVDVLVLDHHQVEGQLPAALALVNPHLSKEAAPPWKHLCSVGLAFKLAHAIVKRGRQNGLPGAAEFDLRPLLDLVALGTIADLVPLQGENRIFVATGLQRLKTTARPGLRALMDVAGINGRLGVSEVGFQLGPRLNAAGRLENALQSLDLLLTTDKEEAERLAQQLDQQNRERQGIERKILEEVLAGLKPKFNPAADYVIVEGQSPWHLGVVGIVASRVLREFYRPTIIIGGDGDEGRGSGRSIEGFDLAAALRSCSDLLTRHGGHAMAAGVSLPMRNLDLFRTRLNDMARQTILPEMLQPTLRLDAVTVLRDLSLECLAELSRLEPFGQTNPPVQMVARNLSHRRPPQRVGKKEQHLKLYVTDGSASCEALWWNCNGHPVPDGRFDLAFVPEISVYQERRSLQLRVLDWQSSA
jgi:single-stranded-DNA-specific exonuclease